MLRGVTGEVRLAGTPVRVHSPKQAKRPEIGIALVPEDRKTDGLMLPMSVRDNLSFAALDRLSRAGIVDTGAESRATADAIAALQIKGRRPGRCRRHALGRQTSRRS